MDLHCLVGLKVGHNLQKERCMATDCNGKCAGYYDFGLIDKMP